MLCNAAQIHLEPVAPSPLLSLAQVYTPWENLKKTSDMAVGQIGFHSRKLVRRVLVDGKDRDVLKRLERTKREEYPDLAAQREAFDRAVARERRQQEQVLRAFAAVRAAAWALEAC